MLWMATGICSFTAQSVTAQSVTMELDTNAIAIGAPASLSIYADRDLAMGFGAFSWPNWGDTLSGGLEILERLPLDTSALEASNGKNLIRVKQTLLVTSWDSGFRAIPPIKLVWNGVDTLNSNPVLLEVRLSPPGEAGKIAAPAQIRQVQWTWQERIKKWLPLIAGILALAGLMFWVVQKLKNKSISPSAAEILSEPVELAHIRALRELERIQADAIWKQGLVKEHHASVSITLRAYLEGRFDFPAMERSTDEIRNGIEHLPIRREEKELIFEVLTLTDLVKFAKLSPKTDDHHRVIERSIRFVELTAIHATESSE